MPTIKRTILLSFSFIFIFSLYSRGKDQSTVMLFDDVAKFIVDDYTQGVVLLDSIESSFSEADFELYKSHLDYVHGCVALRRGDYDKAFYFLDQSLREFMLAQDDDWTSKCLFKLGVTAEVTLLITEAVRFYQLSMDASTSTRTNILAQLGLVMNKKRLGQDWMRDFQDYQEKIIAFADDELLLYSKFIPFWLEPSDSTIVSIMPDIIVRYKELNNNIRVADCYKCFAMYYEMLNQPDSVVRYCSLNMDYILKDNAPHDVLLASSLFLRSKAFFALGMNDQGQQDITKSIRIYKGVNHLGSLYYIYKYLSKLGEDNGNFTDATFYLKNALVYKNGYDNYRLTRSVSMSELFLNIDVINQEVIQVQKLANRRVLLTIILVALVLIVIIVWFVNRKKAMQSQYIFMENRNAKLIVETGDLLDKVGKSRIKTSVLEHQNDIEHKVDRFLKDNADLSASLKEHYAEAILCFSTKLPSLSDSEKRYAAMIALGVPYKVIAQLLSVQPTTVSQYRNRIRKKIGIANTDIELESHLQTFLDMS